jgi:ABC-type microcin C transport system duplicated ATPase subunit YejF
MVATPSVRKLAREGMTMLIATHEMGFARDIADRVCFLEAGRILEQGPPERIFTSPEHPYPPVPGTYHRGRPPLSGSLREPLCQPSAVISWFSVDG